MEIVVRIWHGSMTKPFANRETNSYFPDFHCGLNNKDVGGLFGGHVAIQLGNSVYGFYFKDLKKLHLFPSKTTNCEFQKNSITEWEDRVKDRKETQFFIPVSGEQYQYLLDFFERNIRKPEVDYAVFGERCTSQTFRLLNETSLIKNTHRIWHAYYPGRLASYLHKICRRNGWKIATKPGCNQRIWA